MNEMAEMWDKLEEECGLFGVSNMNEDETAYCIYAGLYTLQHRGQESCGIVVNQNREVKFIKEKGQVREVFTEMLLSQLTGSMGIGHVRAGTTGTSSNINAQPLVTRYKQGPLAIAHNGNLSNESLLREELGDEGVFFQTSTDSEIILHMIMRERRHLKDGGSIEEAVSAAMGKLRGAYSVLLMNGSKMLAFRDPAGMRPLCIGKVGDAWCVSSESCALDIVGAKFVRDVEPGEIVIFDMEGGITSIRDHCGGKSSLCVFEYIYTARTDSIIDGQSVYDARQNAGRILAQAYPVDADVVIGVPDSGLDAARGYALESGIPLGRGLIINRYIGRTFIIPGQKNREAAVRIKINAMRAEVEGKRVVVVDDSIVRGTTVENQVALLREAGALEVHFRISSPPFLWPCYFGTDVPDREMLIAANHSLEEIRQMTGADTLGYLPLDRVKDIAPNATCGLCEACFTNSYPVPLT